MQRHLTQMNRLMLSNIGSLCITANNSAFFMRSFLRAETYSTVKLVLCTFLTRMTFPMEQANGPETPLQRHKQYFTTQDQSKKEVLFGESYFVKMWYSSVKSRSKENSTLQLRTLRAQQCKVIQPSKNCITFLPFKNCYFLFAGNSGLTHYFSVRAQHTSVAFSLKLIIQTFKGQNKVRSFNKRG